MSRRSPRKNQRKTVPATCRCPECSMKRIANSISMPVSKLVKKSV